MNHVEKELEIEELGGVEMAPNPADKAQREKFAGELYANPMKKRRYVRGPRTPRTEDMEEEEKALFANPMKK